MKLLRSKPKNLKEEDVISLLELHDMYDGTLNQIGNGIVHNYTKTGEIIIDEATGLMWQRGGSTTELDFTDAEAYIAGLNKVGYAGYTDWRLPTLEEAMSLMEPEEKNGDLYINPVFDKTQQLIWTSDPLYGERRRWVVSFYSGRCGYDILLGFGKSVRAVRSR